MKALALRQAALWACLAAALLACAGAKEHRYKDGQEVSIWANKGARAGRGGRAAAARTRRQASQCSNAAPGCGTHGMPPVP